MTHLTIIGGGLAGSEAAWQAAQSGFKVKLYEMRPTNPTGAHLSGDLAELVCSNSLGSNLPDRASGVLKNELRQLNSMLLECAEATALPAGAALAVDREAFARMVTQKIESHPNIKIVRAEMKEIPQTPVIIASGPLTSESLSQSIAKLSGAEHLFFFDAIAPIVHAESINMEIAFRASRYNKQSRPSTTDAATSAAPSALDDEGDYINCPFTKDEYYAFVSALQTAERIELRSFEDAIQSGVKAGQFFEGCLPVEVIAERGVDSLAFVEKKYAGLTIGTMSVTPVPEAETYAMMLAGLGLVGFVARRRKQLEA